MLQGCCASSLCNDMRLHRRSPDGAIACHLHDCDEHTAPRVDPEAHGRIVTNQPDSPTSNRTHRYDAPALCKCSSANRALGLGLPGQLDSVPVVLVIQRATNRPHVARRPLLGPLLSIQMRSDWAPGGHANNPDAHTRAAHPSHGYMRYPMPVLCCVGCVSCLDNVGSVYPRNSGNQNTALLARGPDHVSV